MSTALYPGNLPGLAFSVLKTAEYSTIVQRGIGAVETRIANWANPLWHWTLQYSVLFDRITRLQPGLSYTDYRILQGFYLARQGTFDDFLFDDPTDDFVGPALDPNGAPNLQATLQVVNDGAGNYYSPIQRNFGGQFYEDVTDLGPSGITVYANGLLQNVVTNYTIGGPGLAIPGASFAGLYLAWVAPPGTPVTAQFDFLFRTRFETDSQDFEQFMADLWAIGGDGGTTGTGTLKLISSRRTS